MSAWIWALDALFLLTFVASLLHVRRLLEKDAPWWDHSGHVAVLLLAIAWAFVRLDATLLGQAVVLTAAAAAGVPVFRGARKQATGR